MADSPLNNSWPLFSKFWMKRWSFKRASDSKPCVRHRASESEVGCSSPSYLSPPHITKDVFYSTTPEEKDSSEYDCEGLADSADDILALQGTEYYQDLQGGDTPHSLHRTTLSVSVVPYGACLQGPTPCLSPPGLHPVTITLRIGRKEPESMDSDDEALPCLVRSMSTSRRHSWGAPMTPIGTGRRLSLDTCETGEEGPAGPRPAQPHTDTAQSFIFPECSAQSGHDPTKEPEPGGKLSSTCDFLASERRRTVRLLSGSKQDDGVTGGQDMAETLQSEAGQSHMLLVQTVLQELKQYHGAKHQTKDGKEATGSVTWYEFLSKENREEEEQVEKVERGTKVKRTLSSLKNRVTGSFNKDKGKSREKEQQKDKEKEKEAKESSGHHLAPGTFSSLATCSVCCRSLQRKQSLQCQNCAVNVHRSCRNLLPECTTKRSKVASSPDTSSGTFQKAAQVCSRAQRDLPRSSLPEIYGLSALPRGPGMTITPRTPNAQPALSRSQRSGSIPKEMEDSDSRARPLGDDGESITEDAHYVDLRADLDSDAQDLELESWSLLVDAPHLQTHPKEVAKRQDVIYELMQTEMHHVRTLKLMAGVYARELRDVLQMDSELLDRLFPRLEDLLKIHVCFLSSLRQRRRDSLEPGGERNYVIQRLGDILVLQFSGDIGDWMKQCYGDFCGRHKEAVSFYKEQLQNNKRFQYLIRKISTLSIIRRLTVPECILLVTQRITKYPVLLERLLQSTEAGTEEHEDVSRALALIRDLLVHVDAQVNEQEKASRLRDVAGRMEPRSAGKLKDGRVFRREDLTRGGRVLLREGPVSWRAASGRLKDILAVLLTDVLLLLQEKDFKFSFCTVDNKLPVISLQKLIVREVAHEEKAMFLICASSSEPEMYEIHTTSKEERNAWMEHIRQAVENCPILDEGLGREHGDLLAMKMKDFREQLSLKDGQIVQSLAEKLQIFMEFAEITGLEESPSCSRLLLRGDSTDLQRGEQLLKGAISDVETLMNLLVGTTEPPQSQAEGQIVGGKPRRAGTFGGYDRLLAGAGSRVRPRERSQRASSDPQLKEAYAAGPEPPPCPALAVDDALASNTNPQHSDCFTGTEFLDRVMSLLQSLLSLQAVVAQQDSHMELQRASLWEREQGRPGRLRPGTLLEQEKQRNLEKQREELASFQRLQSRHREEQARWERERDRQRRQAEAVAAALLGREEACRTLEAQTARERRELDEQRGQYQQDLERLRESTRAVERERQKLEQQQQQQQRRVRKHRTIGHAGQEMFNGEFGELIPYPRPHARPGLPMGFAEDPERPKVPPRRESAGLPPVKPEVPPHLLSTTNQQGKQPGVQQQIPTKLAKTKGRPKVAQRCDSAASFETRRGAWPSMREDGTRQGRRSLSPQPPPLPPHATDPACPPDLLLDTRPVETGTPPRQPPYKLSKDPAKEDVIYF
ncbi:rho guanine nucleotide exchange factor 18-like isoform X2 [Paramormyrops kingsleyae]|uniref:rho guanine nucleotide exchange factor 18-like isoform X2 n=1 Tax=Paramormyrops kingsleyae TaxID=1676925 RepID=UPI003B96CF7D